MKRRIHPTLAALLAVLLLCACTQGVPSDSSMAEASSAVSDAANSASSALEAASAPGYAFPQPAAIVAPPPYSKPAALPGPALIPLESRPADIEGGGDETSLWPRGISYIPFDATEPVTIPSPIVTRGWGGGGCFVAGEDFIAAAWGDEEIYFGVSRDNGGSWETVEVDAAPFAAASMNIGVCFADKQLGWLEVAEQQGRRAMLYKTIDGGKSWVRTAYFDNAAWLNCYFATEDIGWLTGIYQGDDATALYETADGGASWYPVRLPSPTGGAEFLPDALPSYSPLIGWVLSPYASSDEPAFYLAAGERSMWEYAPPSQFFELPAGMTFEQLGTGMRFELPFEYRQGEGLQPTQVSGFWMACRTEQYIRDNYGEEAFAHTKDNLSYIITAAQINEYARHQYGDAGFDATGLDEYDAGLGGIRHGGGHGGLGKNMVLRQTRLLDGGGIELLYDVVPHALGSTYYYSTGTYRIAVRPATMPNGGSILTLVECGPLTPLPKNQYLNYSV